MSLDKKEKENIISRINSDLKLKQDLERVYKDTYNEIVKDINNFYAKYAINNKVSIQEAKKLADDFDVDNFRDKAREYVQNKDFSDLANYELALYNLTMKINRLELLKNEISLELGKLEKSVLDVIDDYLTNEEIEEAKRQAGILEMVSGLLSDDLENYFNKSNERFSMRFSDKIWHDRETLNNEVDSLIGRALALGKHPRTLAKELEKKFNASRYQTERLLRTEVANAQIDGLINNFKQLGVIQYKIIGEPNACDDCKKIIGKVFNVVDFEKNVTAPTFHPNCRCSITPYVR